MKYSLATLCAALTAPTVTAFVIPRSTTVTWPLQATTIVPERVAPDAGYLPEWEDRPGLTPEEFMKSDMNKPDLSGMWECPLTRWNTEKYVWKCVTRTLVFSYLLFTLTLSLTLFSLNSIDIVQAQKDAAKVPHCPLEIRASEADNQAGAAYFAQNKEQIRQNLLKHGAIWVRGFDLMKSVSGFREMHEALGLDPCLDPLHSSGLRKFASERDALYEEVNKPSLRQHYIGLHCESTTKRTAAYAAFVCFQKATEGGGRFLVADGAAILAELDTKLLEKLYKRQIRISVSNLDLPPALPGFVKEGFKSVVDAAVAPKFDMDLEMIYEADGKPGRLQVRHRMG
jgi:hypothetical protein